MSHSTPTPHDSPSKGAFELTHVSACMIGWKSGLLDILISPYIAQFMGCVIGRIHYGPQVVFYCLPLSTWYETAHRRWTHVNSCRVLSCRGVCYMLLVQSTAFHCHYSIWGCMCSTGPFQLRWMKGYSYSSCYYHHQLGNFNLTHCHHIFPWHCAWDVCYIIFCHLLHMHFRENRDFVFIFVIVQFMLEFK